MSVIEDLLESIEGDARDEPVKQVLVGLHFTAVQSCAMGVAATAYEESCCWSDNLSGAGSLHKRSAFELATLARSAHPLEVSIGMAALNSLLNTGRRDGVDLNARELLIERGRGKNIALIGHFTFVEALREVANQLWVLELQPAPGDYPAAAAPRLLPEADIIGLTATTLTNGTFESLHKLFPPTALVVMIGPTTPLSPLLYDYGVNVLAGTLVTDPDRLLRYIGQGASLRGAPGVRRLTLISDRARVNGYGSD